MAVPLACKPALAARKRILIVDDDPAVRQVLALALEDEGWATEVVGSGEAALARLAAGPVDLVILDERMPGLRGRDVLRELRRRHLEVPVLFLTAYAERELLRDLLELGVGAFCEKPFHLGELVDKVARLVADGRDAPPPGPVPGLVGRSAAMQAVYERIRTFAAADLSVVITGETGVGKERVARAIHALSRRARGPFLALNCANLEPALLESELFGHVAGAFTDARRSKRGLLVEADGGIAFLDEVTELPPACQAKLLKAIQDKEVRPLGGVHSTRIDVRFMAACNEDIREAVRQRRFRVDLFHRLAVGIIHVPPLRERLDDVPDLAAHILARLAAATGKPVRRLTPAALQKLLAYPWPGNVRELENVLELAVAYAEGPAIGPEHIHLPEADLARPLGGQLGDVVRAAEREHILRVLQATQWVKSRAAEVLGIARTTLNRKIREYLLDEPAAPGGSPTGA
ncbi:MAG TPA: sigma-54 dependent transcriptional regulator, partial [Thermodesulfobacteriota bacterium]|nr:sigma-54 dependent transcriptional regulator [Thermodesulfobacteriota bacterium]